MKLLPVLIACLLLPAPLAAQVADPAQQAPAAPFIGKTIVEVRLEMEGRATDDPAVIDLVATRAGQPLVMADVRESIAHLFGLGRFQDVRVEAVEAPGGLRLRYDLIPIHAVQRIDFRGNLGLSAGLLRRTVVNKFGSTPPVGRAVEVARTLEQLYRDHGYLRATVRSRATEKHDPDRTLLEFEIDAGHRAVVRAVEVIGEPLEGRVAFQKAVHAVPSQAYDPIAMSGALAKYVARLKKTRRYLAAASYAARPSEDAASVDVRINLEVGPIVTVTFLGDPLPKDKLAELVPVEREGSVDQDLIEDSIQRIVRYLNQLGYWKADAQAERREADGTLTIAFTVRRGLQYRIADGVEVQGNRAVPLEQLRPALARLQANELFVESNLTSAISAIAGLYQRLGYARAKVTGTTNELNSSAAGPGRVKPAIVITEGPLSVIGSVAFKGDESIHADQLRGVVKVAPGQPYYEPQIVADRDAVLLEYRNRGFESADVVVRPLPSIDGARVDVVFEINEGPQTVVDHILIVGNTRTDQRVIKRELLLQEGKPLGLEDQIESQRRLSALGLFRRIRLETLSHGIGSRKDVLVTVEEAAATTLSYGGGMEATRRLRATGPSGGAQERLELAPRGFFDIGRRNIGGKNRSVDLYTRLSLRPADSTAAGAVSGRLFGFSEYRVVSTYREPRIFGVNADLLFTAAVEQGIRTSFNFARKGVNAEIVRRLSPGVRTSARYSFGTTRTFDEKLTPEEQATIDRIFPQVRLSGLSGAISRDTRDDVLDPTRGLFLSAEGSVAARALGGQVGFMKTYVQGLWFRQLPVRRRAVFATRLALGLADGFPRPAPGETQPIEDLPASERFFAGGDTTIRGFALDSVGAQNTISKTGFPRGGNAVIVMNGELRLAVWRDLGAAVFVDGGNVFNRVTEFDWGELRGSTGFGIRYRSPIGPIRVDVGFKMDRRVIGTGLEPRRALHFSIGQAF
jgi:outer membrane protein assembly complex protein YaeT